MGAEVDGKNATRKRDKPWLIEWKSDIEPFHTRGEWVEMNKYRDEATALRTLAIMRRRDPGLEYRLRHLD